MLVELLPNARGPLIVDACLRLGYVTIAIAALGFLGLGLPPPDPDWGKMISEVRGFGAMAANAMIWPALAISSLVLGLNLLGRRPARNFAEGLTPWPRPSRSSNARTSRSPTTPAPARCPPSTIST